MNRSNSSRKMSKWWIGFLSILLIGCSTALFYINQKMHEHVKVEKPIIALVNEDVPAEFNGKSYNFGKNFVDAVSDDINYDWQVVSRSVADKAYENHSIDAIIYLPNHFSKDILTLQDTVPMQAKIEYKLKTGLDQLSDSILKKKINDLLYTFNKDVIKMYYASIANNLSEAEGYMNKTLDKQESLVTGLTNQISVPFKEIYPKYESVVVNTSHLKSMNDTNVAAQKVFTDASTKILEEMGMNLNHQLPTIEDYLVKQKQMIELNNDNSNKFVTDLVHRNQEFYDKQSEQLHHSISDALSALQSDASDPSGALLTRLNNKITEYNHHITTTQEKINQQIEILKEKRGTLLSIEQNLYQKFFNQTIEPTNELFDFSDLKTNENARAGLANSIKQSFAKEDNISESVYVSKLLQMIANISTDASAYKLDMLVENGSLSPETKAKYEQELQLINNYANAFNVATGKVVLEDISENTSSDTTSEQTISQMIDMIVPAKTTYLSSPVPADIGKENVGKNNVNFNDDGTLELVNDTDQPLSFSVKLSVTLKDKMSDVLELKWMNKTKNEDVSQVSTIFGLVPQDKLSNYYRSIGQSQFDYLTQLFSQIDMTANMITVLYGAPGVEPGQLLNLTTRDEFEHQADNSIFSLYGNMDLNNLNIRLSDEDVANYQLVGQESIDKVVNTLQSLNEVIANLEEASNNLAQNLPNDYFAETIQSLQEWYVRVTTVLEDNYKNMETSDNTQLSLKEWSEQQGRGDALSTDTSTAFYDQIKSLVNTTTQTADATSKSAQTVQDNTKDFDSLVDSAASIQKEAQAILTNSENLANTGNIDLNVNKTYYENFSKVLANTRTQGVDKNHLYNFFASPIVGDNVTPPSMSIMKVKDYDYRWLLVFVIGIILGVLATYSTNKFFKK